MYQDLGSITPDLLSASPSLHPILPAEGELNAHELGGIDKGSGPPLVSDPDELTISDAELATLSSLAPAGDGEVDAPPDAPATEMPGTIVVIGTRPAPPDIWDLFYWWLNQPTSTEPTYPGGIPGSIQDRATPAPPSATLRR